MAHGHAHTHGMVGAKLRTAFLLTVVILLVEIVGGVLSNSLALFSDAGHVFTDVVALGLAWFAARQAERPADSSNTYGYHRTGILIALINAGTLIAIVLYIAIEAIRRFQNPEAVTPTAMFAAAAVGIVVNLFIGFSLRSEEETNLNIRAAMLHVFGDVGASAGVVIAGLVIVLTRWYPVDPLLSLGIAALIAVGAWNILRETVGILMEATPANVNIAQLVRDMMRVHDVDDVHDLHLWSLAGGLLLLTAHVEVAGACTSSRYAEILTELNDMLQDKYGIAHATIQIECARCPASEIHCAMVQPGQSAHVHASSHSH